MIDVNKFTEFIRRVHLSGVFHEATFRFKDRKCFVKAMDPRENLLFIGEHDIISDNEKIFLFEHLISGEAKELGFIIEDLGLFLKILKKSKDGIIYFNNLWDEAQPHMEIRRGRTSVNYPMTWTMLQDFDTAKLLSTKYENMELTKNIAREYVDKASLLKTETFTLGVNGKGLTTLSGDNPNRQSFSIIVGVSKTDPLIQHFYAPFVLAILKEVNFDYNVVLLRFGSKDSPMIIAETFEDQQGSYMWALTQVVV